MSAVEIARDVGSGKLSPVDVVEAFIAAIEARNGVFNALVRFAPELAQAEARAVAQRLAVGERLPLAAVSLMPRSIWAAISGSKRDASCRYAGP